MPRYTLVTRDEVAAVEVRSDVTDGVRAFEDPRLSSDIRPIGAVVDFLDALAQAELASGPSRYTYDVRFREPRRLRV
jgi:hypothetical protein